MPTSRVTDDQLRAAAPQAENLAQLLVAVGLSPRGGNYEVHRRRLRALGIDDPRLFSKVPAAPPDEEVARVVADSRSLAESGRRLGLGSGSSGHRRVAALVARLGLDTSHLLGKGANAGRRDLPPRRRPLDELLRAGSRPLSPSVRRRLLTEGVLQDCCAGCGGTSWQGGPMPLELDHVNGDRTDNRRENLRWLCPNCHALTSTYRGRNTGRQASYRAR